MLFRRGKLISQAPINIGTNQLPKPPIAVGITKKKSLRMREMLLKHCIIGNFQIKEHHLLDLTLNALTSKQRNLKHQKKHQK